MDFTHYTDEPVSLAVDIVNTRGWTSGTEHLKDLDDLTALLGASAGTWNADLPAPDRSDVDGVRELRTRLRQVFDAANAQSAADQVNALLTDHDATPSLSTHGAGPHLHFEPAGGSLTDWLAVITAMGIATVIADHGFERLGVCRAPGCLDAYVDTSRNRSRKHCSDTCRSRENVAAHRQRQRSQS